MIPQPKFDLGQYVYAIACNRVGKYVNCTTCVGKKYILINNESFTCPKCRGSGSYHNGEEVRHMLAANGFIGKISIEAYDQKYDRPNTIRYQLDSTGVGSGTLWDEENLFSSKSKAMEEIFIRNKNHEHRISEE